MDAGFVGKPCGVKNRCTQGCIGSQTHCLWHRDLGKDVRPRLSPWEFEACAEALRECFFVMGRIAAMPGRGYKLSLPLRCRVCEVLPLLLTAVSDDSVVVFENVLDVLIGE